MKYSAMDYPVPTYIAEQVRELLEGKRRELDFSYTTKVNQRMEDTCGFCREDVCSCVDETGWRYDAKIEVDESGKRWATLTTPHDCPEGRRFQEHLNMPSEPEVYGEEEE